MLYVLIGRDGPEAARLRPELRPQHLEHLGALSAAGRIRIAGPLTDGAGSLIIVEADSEEEAERFSEEDPYRRGGVFESVEIHPFKQVLPETAA